MNNKGFTLVEMLTAITLLSLVMLLVFPNILKIKDQNDLKTYNSYEKMMVEYAQVYATETTSMITLTELQAAGLKGINNCSGYVLIDGSGNSKTYTAYISCGDNYTTEDYNSGFLNTMD